MQHMFAEVESFTNMLNWVMREQPECDLSRMAGQDMAACRMPTALSSHAI